MDILDEAANVAQRAADYDEHEAIHALLSIGLHAWPELEQGYTSYLEAYQAGMYGPVAERQEWRERAQRIWTEWEERARALELI